MSTEKVELNPYVGPRPFERGEQDRTRFFGRDRETQEIVSLIFGHPLVLVYAQSGAGKTSLFNARIAPTLEEKGFEVLPVARVRGVIPEGIEPRDIENLYMFNALVNLDAEVDPGALVDKSLAAFLQRRPRPTSGTGRPTPQVIIFDQFEELFTLYPVRWREQQEEFFRQVAEAVDADPLLRCVFVIREDFLAQLDPFAELLPEGLRIRFRLERLRKNAALMAVNGPLRDTKRSFAEGTAEQLVEELLKVQVQTATGDTRVVSGEFVEPVQLQVVCRSLWRDLPPDVTLITQDHLQAFGDVSQALSAFYERSIGQTVKETRVRMRKLRPWFERSLITPAGTRGTVYRGPEKTGDVPNAAVDVLEDLHLIRGEWRAGARWYELTHDRFIEPIQESNQTWTENRRRALFTTLGAAAAALVVILMIAFGTTWATQSEQASQYQREAQGTVAAVEVTAAAVEGAATKQAVTAAAVERAATMEAVAAAAVEGTATIAAEVAATAEQQLAIVEQQDSAVPFLKVVMRGHTDEVKSVAFSPDGKFVVTASSDHTARVWEANTGQSITELHGHTEAVNSAAFSPDGKFVVTTSSDHTARVWDPSTGQSLIVMRGHGGPVWMAAFSPDGKFVVTASQDNTAWVWDAMTGEGLFELRGHTDEVTTAKFSSDGKWILTASPDNTARVWDAATGVQLTVLEGHTNRVSSAVFSPDGAQIVTASDDHTARVWDAATGKQLTVLEGHTGGLNSVAFHPGGQFVITASGDKTARVWDLSAGRSVVELLGHADGVNSAVFSQDGMFAVTASEDNTARVWASTGMSTAELRGHTGGVNSALFSPDGQFAVTASRDNTARMWEAGTAGLTIACVPALIAPKAGAVLDNGRLDRQDVVVWDFDWDDCEGATSYHLYVQGSEATIPVIDDSTISQSSYHWVSQGYIADRNRFDWTWKVRAKVDDQWGEWSEIWMFDAEPVDSDPPLVTHSTGPLEIPQTWTADLDEGVVGAGSDADIWFEAVTATERYVTPQNGASVAVVGISSVGRDGCAAAPLSTARIDIDDLPVGTYVCVQTNLGRYSQFRVNAPMGPSPGTLVLGYTTWE